MAEGFLSEFDREMSKTRRMLEGVREDMLHFAPHPKSLTAGQLAGHIAEMIGWGRHVADLDEFDYDPPGGPRYRPFEPSTRASVLESFDRNYRDAREAIAKVSDEAMLAGWTLLEAGQPVLSLSRIEVLKRYLVNHIIHHRAQLGVYLRLNDIPVPGMYGPSADET